MGALMASPTNSNACLNMGGGEAIPTAAVSPRPYAPHEPVLHAACSALIAPTLRMFAPRPELPGRGGPLPPGPPPPPPPPGFPGRDCLMTPPLEAVFCSRILHIELKNHQTKFTTPQQNAGIKTKGFSDIGFLPCRTFPCASMYAILRAPEFPLSPESWLPEY